jgi:hypothetical protein
LKYIILFHFIYEVNNGKGKDDVTSDVGIDVDVGMDDDNDDDEVDAGMDVDEDVNDDDEMDAGIDVDEVENVDDEMDAGIAPICAGARNIPGVTTRKDAIVDDLFFLWKNEI